MLLHVLLGGLLCQHGRAQQLPERPRMPCSLANLAARSQLAEDACCDAMGSGHRRQLRGGAAGGGAMGCDLPAAGCNTACAAEFVDWYDDCGQTMRASGVDVSPFNAFIRQCAVDPGLAAVRVCQTFGGTYVRVPGHESRTHCVHAPPPPRAPREGYPLILFMHGYTSNGAETDAYVRLSSLAAVRGFISVMPDSTTGRDGKTFWSATDACCK